MNFASLKKKTYLCKLFFFCVLLLFALLNAFNNITYADFYPLNGDFQNYNPIRRLLAGQVPFRDFEVYLGLGHLYSGAILTKVFGGTFFNSLYAMHTLTFLFFELTVYVIFWAILKTPKQAAVATMFIATLNLVQFENILPINTNSFLTSELKSALSICKVPGNSARIIRSSICAFAPTIAFLLLQTANVFFDKKQIFQNEKKYIFVMIIAAVSSISFLYSNDYGISTAIVMVAFTGIACIKFSKNAKEFSVYALAGSVVFFIIFALMLIIITCGHPLSYIKTTLGVNSYQPWYAVHDPASRLYFLWNIPIFAPRVILTFVIAIVYAYHLFYAKLTFSSIRRFGIPLSIVFTTLFAIHLYRFSDGGGTEYFDIVFFCVIVAELIRFIQNFLTANNQIAKIKLFIALNSAVIAIFISFACSVVIKKMDAPLSQIKSTYIKELGGNVTALGETIIASKNKLENRRVFNTYASAVETVTHQFQPSGVDYIIHCLGDKQREKYINAFYESNADYVGVIRESYAAWENYIRGVNWFFYREFLDNYAISFSNAYQHYYAKVDSKQKISADCYIDVQKQTDCETLITIYFPSQEYNGLADIKLNYELEKRKSRRNIFNYKQIGCVHDYNIPADKSFFSDIPLSNKHSATYIPVIIKNGIGSIRVSSYPTKYSCIDIINVTCSGLFPSALDIVQADGVRDIGSGNYELTFSENLMERFSSPIRAIQHENLIAHVKDCRQVMGGGGGTILTISSPKFAQQLDSISSIKVLTVLDRNETQFDISRLPIRKGPILGFGNFCLDTPLSQIKSDFFDSNKNTILLRGWALDVDMKTTLKDMYVQKGKSFIKAQYGLFRPDVSAASRMPVDNCGFYVLVPKDFLLGSSDLTFVLAGNDYMYEPIKLSLVFLDSDNQ